MQLRKDQVLVVARVADQGRAIIQARQVLDTLGGAHDAHMHAVRLVELRIEIRPASIHRRQIEERAIEVDQPLGIELLLGHRSPVKSHVVINELPEEHLTGQNVRILQRRPSRFTHLRRELLQQFVGRPVARRVSPLVEN